jgi:hypothetical protein
MEVFDRLKESFIYEHGRTERAEGYEGDVWEALRKVKGEYLEMF